MPTKEDKAKYDIQYAKSKLKRSPLDVQKEEYEQIKAAADAADESVNGYIKQAIRQRMQRDARYLPCSQRSACPVRRFRAIMRSEKRIPFEVPLCCRFPAQGTFFIHCTNIPRLLPESPRSAPNMFPFHQTPARLVPAYVLADQQ